MLDGACDAGRLRGDARGSSPETMFRDLKMDNIMYTESRDMFLGLREINVAIVLLDSSNHRTIAAMVTELIPPLRRC
jgi:hypothetical protein